MTIVPMISVYFLVEKLQNMQGKPFMSDVKGYNDFITL